MQLYEGPFRIWSITEFSLYNIIIFGIRNENEKYWDYADQIY